MTAVPREARGNPVTVTSERVLRRRLLCPLLLTARRWCSWQYPDAVLDCADSPTADTLSAQWTGMTLRSKQT